MDAFVRTGDGKPGNEILLMQFGSQCGIDIDESAIEFLAVKHAKKFTATLEECYKLLGGCVECWLEKGTVFICDEFDEMNFRCAIFAHDLLQ